MKIRIVFDKEKAADEYLSGWGVSYLIDDKILFDTGEKGEYLFQNMKAMKIDPKKIEKVVISHKHWDHQGGLKELLNFNKAIEVFKPEDSKSSKPEKISDNIYTSGCLRTDYKAEELIEQALILRAEKGLSLVCGCAHPGILQFLKVAKTIFPQEKIYSIIGGFHFIDQERRYIEYVAEELLKNKVQSIGPGHCTGFEAKRLLKKCYPNNFFEIKVGEEIDV